MLNKTVSHKIKQVFIALNLLVNKHFNLKIGALSGIATGLVVFYINYPFGLYPALGSFVKQFIFNLLMAGYNTKTCEKITLKVSDKTWALIGGAIIPTIQAFAILYAIHYFGNTPKPLASTWWQAAGNVFFFLAMALIYQHKKEKKTAAIQITSKFLPFKIKLF